MSKYPFEINHVIPTTALICLGIITSLFYGIPSQVSGGHTEICWDNEDAYVRNQWGWFSVEADDAWKSGYTGENVTIGIFDTGINLDHPELENVEIIYKHNYIEDSDNVSDEIGHGAHVAGTIVAATNNGGGISGIAPNVNLAVFKVINEEGELRDLSEAIEDANGMDIDIYNLSLGGDTLFWPMGRTRLRRAYEQGTVIVAAAGNDNSSNVPEPASYEFTISVGAVKEDNERAEFSNYGEDLDIMAPGQFILSTYITDPPSGSSGPTYTDPPYGYLSGTSMATPHVTGVVALLLGKEPNLSPGEVQSIIENTSENLGDPYYYGAGLVNAKGALGLLKDENPPIPPDGLESTGVGSYEVSIDWTDNPEPDFSYYKIYRDTSSDFTLDQTSLLGESKASYFSDNGLEENITYFYRLVAVDRSCNESQPSSELSVKTEGYQGPELGDSNWDGEINIWDALQIARFNAGLEPSPFYDGASDVRGCNGRINILDALAIARFDANLINSFECENS